MAKLKNVTEAEIAAVIAATDDSLQTMHDLVHRMETGYCDALAKPAELARNYCWIAKAATSMAGLILAKAGMQEQKAELDALMKERATLKG